MILLMLVARYATFSMSAGAGAAFARTVMYCCYGCLTILGGMYFSAAIVEEKEEQTLPLLRLTGASTLAILLGKSAPRLVSVLLLLLIVVPFLLLAITLGGVSLKGILTAIFGLLVYAVMFCQLGLLCSVVARNFQDALTKTLMLWALLEFLPFWGWCGSTVTLLWSSHSMTAEAVRCVNDSSLFSSAWSDVILSWLHIQMKWLTGVTTELTLYENLSFYLIDFGGDPVWRPQMTAHLTAAAVFLVASWLLFEPMTARVVSEGFESAPSAKRRTRTARRVHGKALVWKSWQWLTGGWFWFWIRLVVIPVCVAALASTIAWGLGENLELWVLSYAMLLCGTVVFIAAFAILFDRLFAAEIQQKTMDSLLLLPYSRHSLIRQMAAGLLPAIAASLSCFVCGLAILIVEEPRAMQVAGTVLTSAWLYAVLAILVSTLYVGLFLSVKLRYGGMLVSIVTLWFIAPMLISCFVGILSLVTNTRAVNDLMTTAIPTILILVLLALSVWMHKLLVRGLDQVGAES